MCYRVHAALVRRTVVILDAQAPVDHVVGLVFTSFFFFRSLSTDEVDLDCFNAVSIPLSFRIPKSEAQTFSTSWISNLWVLKFVFICAQHEIPSNLEASELYD